MNSKTVKKMIALVGLAFLAWANIANPTAFADSGDRSFNNQTVPTRTPQGSHPTNTPKPPKEPTETPVPPPPAVGVTITPAPSVRTATPQAAKTAAPTAIVTASATSNAAQPTATTAPAIVDTLVPSATAPTIAATPTGSTVNLPLVTTDTQGTPPDNSGNSSPSIFLIGGAIVLLLVGLYLIFGRSKPNDQTKPQ
jgi:hypothetical protein